MAGATAVGLDPRKRSSTISTYDSRFKYMLGRTHASCGLLVYILAYIQYTLDVDETSSFPRLDAYQQNWQ